MKHSRHQQLGQDVTEYIIIVALLAIAAIAIYGLFGDTVRGQAGASEEQVSARQSDQVTAPSAQSARPLAAQNNQR